MDFFESQEFARHKTGRLIALFVGAVLAIVLVTYIVVVLILTFGGVLKSPVPGGASWVMFWKPGLLLGVGVIVVAVVAIGSWIRIMQLRAGGHIVAESLGGCLLSSDTNDATQRRVLNVVEEMAIASGVPVPDVYLLDDEQGINAFAAGYQPDQAVIGITRGCAETLSRDELQGVVAHEFSHILNGDMRINIRLMGVLHGILAIGLIGHTLLWVMPRGRTHARKGKGDGTAMIVLLGLALMIIGFVGVMFGNLIKAAISRQREYLADASAVQFTRNPGGIGGALQKIGGLSFGSRVEHTNAAQASHMFFSQSFVGRLFATHPPLSVRILRIDPGWDGKYPHVAPTHTDAREPGRPPPLRASHQERRQLNAQMLQGQAVGAATALALIGQTSQEHLQHAQSLVASIPDAVMHAAHEPFGARAVVYALLMDQDGQVRKAQWARLDAHADEQVLKLTRQLIDDVRQLSAEVRLPLLDMTIPALRQLAAVQYASFKVNVQELIHADDRVTLFEWMLRRMILAHLEPRFQQVAQRRPHIATLAGVKRECRVLLSGLAYAGHREETDAEAAYASARVSLQITDVMLPRAECGLARIDQALDKLAGLAPRLRKRVIYACTTCITDDEQITVTEGELLRAVADALGCPMPPLLPGQALT